MDVKMHTIKAGPDGCADAGATISLPDVEAKRLIDGKFAVAVTRPNRETAMIDPARQAQIDRDQAKAHAKEEAEKEAKSKGAETVGKALKALDPADDDDWTAKGKPAIGRVKELTGSATITRAELSTLYPGFARPVDDAVTAVPDKTTADSSEAATAPVSGARSNRP